MILYVFALGGALFGTLGAGVVVMESRGVPGNAPNVTIVTPGPAVSATSSAAVIISPSAVSTPTPKAAATRDRVTILEDEVTGLVNAERAKNGCPALRTDERLRKAARAHSADMAQQNYFSHDSKDGSSPWQRMERAGYPKGAGAAENIAMGYATPQAVVKGWMNSDGHRKNILNCSSKAVGVGLAYRGNTPYWTQDFGRS